MMAQAKVEETSLDWILYYLDMEYEVQYQNLMYHSQYKDKTILAQEFAQLEREYQDKVILAQEIWND